MDSGILPTAQCPAGNIYREIVRIQQLDVLLIQVAAGRIGFNGNKINNRTCWLGIGYLSCSGGQAILQLAPALGEVVVLQLFDCFH
jgi:hypothetical protein